MNLPQITTHLKIPLNPDGSSFSPEQSGMFIINHVVGCLYQNYKVAYYEYADLYQEGVMFALSGIATGAYNGARPLEKFLYRHIKNRFINFTRDKFYRNPGPCKKCPFFDKEFLVSDNQCSAFTDKRCCDKFSRWNRDSEAKKQLAGQSHETHEYNVRQKHTFDTVAYNELDSSIQASLPGYLLDDYRKLKNGDSIQEGKRLEIASIVRLILKDDDV